jgi:RNA polymerase sigma-70 factor (ECF subfamily)
MERAEREAMDSAGVDNPSPAIDWCALLERQRARWLALLRSRLRDGQAAEDVFQNVALAVAGSNRRPEREADAAPWFYRIAVRQCLMFRRSAGRRARLANNYAEKRAPKEAASRGDPLRWLMAEERRRAFDAALALLPELDRQILVLRTLENWSYRQLAEAHGVSERTIEHRLFKARRRLRDLIDRAGWAEGLP